MRSSFICVFVLACMTIALGTAQTNGGNVSGVLLDVSGNPAGGETLTIENIQTTRTYSATTDQSGRFRFESLPAGEYRVITDLSQTTAMTFEVRTDREVQLELKTAAGGAPVERVGLTVIPINTDTGQISTDHGGGSIELLSQPNYMPPSDEVFGAYNLSLSDGAVTAPNPAQGAHGPIVTGIPPISNNFHVDGADNNNRAVPGPLVYLSNEATSEFSMRQNSQRPQFGHAAGGQLNSIMSTGANEVHGSAYWYLQNRELNAMEPAFEARGLEENPRFDQNRIGGTIGFPIVKNSLFGLANFEYIPLRFDRAMLGRTLVPTTAGFGLLSTMPGVSNRNLNVLRSNVSGVPGTVATTTVNGATIPLGLASTNIEGETERYMGAATLDWAAGASDQFSLHYVQNEIESPFGAATLPAFSTATDTTALLASFGYSKIFNPNTVNNLRFSYNRFDQDVFPGEFEFAGLDAFPNIQIQGLGIGLGPQPGADRSRVNTFQLGDDLSIASGAHQFRLGFDGRRILSSFSGLSSFRGDYTYSTLERFVLDRTPDVVAQRSFGDPTLNGNQWLWMFYVQDTWRLTPRVNLELGLSTQYASMPESLRRQRLGSDLDEPGLLEFLEPVVDNLNFAPRVGLAYSPDNRTVFRAGAGMTYDALYTGTLPNLLLAPTLNTVTVVNPLSTSPNFLGAGGIPEPAVARARVGSFIGDQQLPYYFHWNAGAQKALVGGLTFEVNYIGNRGLHLPTRSRLNSTSLVSATNSLPVFFEAPSDETLDSLDLTLQSLRGVPDDELVAAGFVNPITTINQGGSSMYNALVVGLQHRFSRGLQLRAAYTYSDTEINSFNSPFDLSLSDRERFDAPWEQEHRLTATGILDMAPLLAGAPGFVRYVVANFSLMGTYTYASEQRLPVSSGLDTALSGNALGSATFVNPAGFANRASGVTPLRNRAGQTVAYLADDPQARFVQGGFGTFSSGGIPMLPLDQTNNFDVSAVKRFGYRDIAAFELRADAYNVFNHPQFTGNRIRSIENPFLGASSALPLFLNPSSTEFGNLRHSLSGNPRVLQLALRVTF